jgi:hypothetical protein
VAVIAVALLEQSVAISGTQRQGEIMID